MATEATELVEAVARNPRPQVAQHLRQVEAERAELLERFPVDAWPGLSLERYALGSVRDPVPYCAMLEYRTPYLGSIRGGSARKHIIYRQSSGEWWRVAPLQELEPEEAWVRLRGEFVAAIERVTSGDVDGLTGMRLLGWGQALVTKTLALYAPLQFLRIYSGDHIRRFIRLMGAEPDADAPSWRLNRQLKRLVDDSALFAGWDQEEVLQFFYTYLDPRGGALQVLKVAPGEGGRLWEDCLRDGVVRVGFSDVPDLRTMTDDEDLLTVVDRAYPDKGGSYHKKLVRQLQRFRDLPAGARIVANKGTSEIYAVGTVTDGGYRYDETLPEYRHIVSVDWDTSYAQRLESPVRGWVPTFNNVPDELWRAIERGRRDRPRGAGWTAADPSAASQDVPADVKPVLAALERKGQVILHGPPGTGKTRLALSAALALGGRAAAALASPAERSSEIRALLEDGGGETVVCAFHPSLGYEDFVEGYKPVPTERGGLALELRDGVFKSLCDSATAAPDSTFVLVIDEINRADLARVLGELLTLLEQDKRGLPVRLAVSGRSFSVPPNIRIIGTMNTADRSVAHLDAAVRRRFGFVAVPADPALLDAAVGPLHLATLLTELNGRIAAALSNDHRIGHSYLMEADTPLDSADAVASAFYQDVVPLLEDHVLGDDAMLLRLLGPELVDETDGSVRRLDPEDLVITLANEFSADAVTPE